MNRPTTENGLARGVVMHQPPTNSSQAASKTDFPSTPPIESAELEKREQARIARQHQLAQLCELAAGLAHELKNPLSTVKLNLQLLQEDLAKLPGAQSSQSRAATLRKEVDRLSQTLDDFLRFAGRLEIRTQSVKLNDLVRDLIDFFQPQAAAAGVRLHASLSPADPVCQLDANLFKQALLNLMLNGIQAMPKGGELIIRTHVDQGRAFVDVSDTGVGIALDTMPRIFEAYFTTKKGGTGLGLATTRRIIEEHRGHIWVTSEPGKGTNFRMELPMAR
ncbi:MAG TPA: ATP-binding protein [Phycisphaerae bacterium]|nr:ATP-binding protein [Phycisphaerae bacterium]